MNREVHVQFWEGVGLRCPALLAYLKAYQSVAEARQGIAAYFDFYNHERLHQALDYRARARCSRKRRVCPSSGAREIPLVPIRFNSTMRHFEPKVHLSTPEQKTLFTRRLGMEFLEAGYGSPITFEECWMAIFNGNKSILPPYWKPGTYMVFEGTVSRYVGRQYIDYKRGGLLGRTINLIVDAFGITGDGVNPRSEDSYFHSGGRRIFLHFKNRGGNAAVRKLQLVWRDDDICLNCEEYRIYAKYNGKGGGPLLNSPVAPCKKHPHP